MNQVSIQRGFISLLAIARAVVAGHLPDRQVTEYLPTLDQLPAGYQGQELQRGLGFMFRLFHGQEDQWLLELENMRGFFAVQHQSPAELAAAEADELAALQAAPYVLCIRQRRFPAHTVEQAVGWATFLIGYLPLFPQGFIVDPEFLRRDYEAIAQQMEQHQIGVLHGTKGLAYLLPRAEVHVNARPAQEGGSHAH